MGWHPAGDRELFTIEELIKEFSLKRLTKAGTVFDLEKLKWMNGHYIKTLDLNDIVKRAEPYFADAGMKINDPEQFKQIIEFARERVSTLAELPEVTAPFFRDLDFTEEDMKIINEENSQNVFRFWKDNLPKLENLDDASINDLLKKTTEETGAKGKNLYFPLRLALFGSVHGPELTLIINILGIEKSVKRFENTIT